MKYIILALIAAAAGFLLWQRSRQNNELPPYEGEGLTHAQYSYGGGMEGDSSGVSLTVISEDEVIVHTWQQKAHYTRRREKKYRLSSYVLEGLDQIIRKYRLDRIPEMGYEQWEILDGSTGSYSFEYGNGLRVSYSSTLDMSSFHSEGSQEFVKYLYSLADGEPYEETLSPRQLRLSVGGYSLIYNLDDSYLADQLITQLPLTVNIEPYSDNEMIFYPPEKLDCEGAQPASGGAGILAYYEPWGDVVMFTGDFAEAPGLYRLGEVEYQFTFSRLTPGEYHIYGDSLEE